MCIRDRTGSAYQQQRRFFLARNEDREPREALFEDLDKEVKRWNRANKNIIIAGDFNADVRSKEVQDWMGKWKLREGILEMHGANAPPTFNNGSKPIDAIFVSKNIEVTRSGYLGFGEGEVGDHRCLWIDVSNKSLLGYSPKGLTRPSERRVTTKHPWAVSYTHLTLPTIYSV